MTIAINGRFLLNSFGGVRRFATELTVRLARERDDVVLLLPAGGADLGIPDVPYEVVGRFGGPVWEQVELPSWLRRHGHPVLLNFANIAPVFYRRQITVLHDIAPALRPGDFSLLFRIQWQLSTRLGALRRGRGVVTVSEQSRAEICSYFRLPRDRVDVVYNGADSFAAPAGADVADRTPVALVFGRHGAAKNVRRVVDAAAALPDGSPLRVRVVGQLDPALEPYARDVGIPAKRLAWVGPVTDEELAREYSRARVFVWPSLHEGFGIPPLEAQALGTPVIASDIPINREILGDSALYFAPHDAAALANLLRAVTDDDALHTELAAAGRRNASRFTWAETTRHWNTMLSRDSA
ncbi:glycosyltransferase family 1 protein [Microbacterium schleiferi]|uniref:glycosyltransferase family 4 protein n=1 Tax=Microbacterium schleiferi TaxID=69362 RepID=UPI00311E60B5